VQNTHKNRQLATLLFAALCPHMNRALEIHDSTFAGTSNTNCVLVIHLNKAYIHESAGTPGVDNGKGFVQEIELELSDAIIEKNPTHVPSKLSDGYISINGNKTLNGCNLPLNKEGDIVISFITTQNEQFVARGSKLVSTLLGVAEYVEEFKA
jgi:hypothetical protein